MNLNNDFNFILESRPKDNYSLKMTEILFRKHMSSEKDTRKMVKSLKESKIVIILYANIYETIQTNWNKGELVINSN